MKSMVIRHQGRLRPSKCLEIGCRLHLFTLPKYTPFYLNGEYIHGNWISAASDLNQNDFSNKTHFALLRTRPKCRLSRSEWRFIQLVKTTAETKRNLYSPIPDHVSNTSLLISITLDSEIFNVSVKLQKN